MVLRISFSPRRFQRVVRASRLAVVAIAVMAGGCTDAPTFPAALQWLADGEEWVAVLPPAGLPHTTEWARFAGGAEEAAALAGRLSALESAAALALSHGDVSGATRLRSDAVHLLSRSLTRAPDAAILADAASAVDLWDARVREAVGVGHSPALAAALDSISAARSGAAAALQAGDTIGAAASLVEAGERIRSWSPTAVAVRVVERAASRVGALPDDDPAAERARHLLLSSRQALRTGDPMRAMQRAIYALQLAAGQQMPGAPADTR